MLLRPAILAPNNHQSAAHVFKSLESRSATRTPYIAELDGIRALAFAFVFLVHTMPVHFPGGFVGVDIFFVLSGYLITKILYAEFESTGRIDLRNFYVRRTLRLMPAFLVMLFAYVLLVFINSLHNHSGQFLRENILAALTSALYVMNWTQAFHLGPSGSLIHTWSLATEEQFYLIWPLTLICVIRTTKRKEEWKAIGLLISMSAAWQLFWVSHGASVDRLYFGFDMRLITLLTGCLLALAPPGQNSAVRDLPIVLSYLASRRDAADFVLDLFTSISLGTHCRRCLRGVDSTSRCHRAGTRSAKGIP